MTAATSSTHLVPFYCPPTTTDKPMQLHNGKYTMHLEVDEDTYWGLVKLGAEIKTDSETYAENILIGHVETELNREAAN